MPTHELSDTPLYAATMMSRQWHPGMLRERFDVFAFIAASYNRPPAPPAPILGESGHTPTGSPERRGPVLLADALLELALSEPEAVNE